MQVNVQRRAGDLRGGRIRERDAPGQRSRLAVAAAGGEAAQAANGVAERQRGGEMSSTEAAASSGNACRERCQHGADDSAVKCAAGLKRGDAENFARMRAVIVPIAQDQPDFRDDQRNEDRCRCPCSRVLSGSRPARGAWRRAYHKPSNDARRDQHAVGVNR